MWKYVVNWGLFAWGIINDPVPNFGKPGFERVGNDSSVFFDRDSAFAYRDNVEKNWLVPPHQKRGRCFFVKVDSVWIEQPKKKHFLFFKL